MKPLLSLLVLLACGCSSLTKEQRFILDAAKELRGGNSSFYFEVHDKRGITKISFANPTIGFSSSAGPQFVTQNSPTNIPIALQYHAYVPGASMPVQNTNQVPKSKP